MLVLTRRPGESIFIGDDIEVVITRIDRYSVRVAIAAPPDVAIYRQELYREALFRRGATAPGAEPGAEPGVEP